MSRIASRWARWNFPGFVALLVGPSSAHDGEDIFHNDFNSGELSAWSDVVGSDCPLFRPPLDHEEGTLVASSPLIALYAGYKGYVEAESADLGLLVETEEDYGGPTGPDTIVIEGPELNYATCGTCIRILEQISFSGGTVDRQFLAQTGMLTLSEYDLASEAGAIEGVMFHEVTIDDQTFESTLVPDDCRVWIGSHTYSVSLDSP